MKILLANKFFFRNGGSEVVMFQERDYLLASGHQVVDFSMRDERNLPSDYADQFIERQDYRGGGKWSKLKSAASMIHSPEAVRRISALIQATRPDLVHCHNIYHQLTPSIIGAAKKLGIPVVLTLHDYKPVCPVYNRLSQGKPCSACIDGDFTQVMKRRCADGSLGKSALLYAEAAVQRMLGNYEQVDAFIAPSRFMQESISHRIPVEKVRLLYNGMDTEGVHGTGADDGYALYLGRLSAEKGVDTLLQAHASSLNGWKLVVAGTGPLEAELRLTYKHASFIGHVTGDRLREVIDRASVVVVPSEWYENCPMSVLEAMAYGKPVVGSRMGGIPELVLDGETGFLFEAGSVDGLRACLDQLMQDGNLRRRLGANARQRVQADFSIDGHNTGLMDIYESILKAG